MKFDPELVREILLEIEAAPPNRPPELKLPNREPDAVLEHLHLLKERGLIEAKILPNRIDSRRLYHAHVEGLTWEGHVFLQNAKNAQIWSRAMKVLREKGGSVSFEILKTLLARIAAEHMGLPGS